MTYEEFKDELWEQATKKSEWGLSKDNVKFYNDGFSAPDDENEQKFIRDTNIRYHKTESDVLIGDFMVINIQKPEEDIKHQCRLDLNALYEDFGKLGWEFVWKVVKNNIDLGNQLFESGIVSLINDYNAVKEKLIIRPINYTDNKYSLKEAIYKRIGDIALVLYLVMYENKVQGLGTTKIHKETFQKWGKDFEEVWEAALTNTYVLAPPRMYLTPAECTDPPYERGAFMALGSKIKSFGKLQTPTVTTTKQVNGAIAVFYPGVKEKIASMAGGSYYVAFTSIHEARIHCVNTVPPRTILSSIKRVNKAFDPEEILTRKVYYYDAEKDTFDMLEL